MKKHINASQIANEVLMLKGKNERASFVIVEGRTDSVGYCWLLNSQCKPIVAHSKTNVVETINLLDSRRVNGVLGIVDSDFLNLHNDLSHSHNVVRTDSHDIETLVINSPALEKVLLFYGDETKLYPIDQVIHLLIEAARPLGYLRFISHKRGLNLNFKNLSFHDFIDDKTLEVNIEELLKQIVTNTKNCKLQVEDLRKILQYSLNKFVYDPWQICCGHDLVEIFSISLSNLFGSFGNPAKVNSLAKWLLLAYESVYFQRTNLYTSILEWEMTNVPFLILSEKYKTHILDPVG